MRLQISSSWAGPRREGHYRYFGLRNRPERREEGRRVLHCPRIRWRCSIARGHQGDHLAANRRFQGFFPKSAFRGGNLCIWIFLLHVLLLCIRIILVCVLKISFSSFIGILWRGYSVDQFLAYLTSAELGFLDRPNVTCLPFLFVEQGSRV